MRDVVLRLDSRRGTKEKAMARAPTEDFPRAQGGSILEKLAES